MKEAKSFYYQFNPINVWLVFNAVMTIIFGYALFKCPCLFYWWQSWVLIGVLAFSIAMWTYKYAFRHRMALIDDKTIKIDHCQPLAWKDVEYAEEKIVRCGWKKYKIISLVAKKGINYKYNFLQRHNCEFGAFSVPMYGIISDKDAKEIKKIIADKVKLKPLKD